MTKRGGDSRTGEEEIATGRVMARVPGLVLISDGTPLPETPVAAENTGAVLMPRLIEAFTRLPGTSRDALFQGGTLYAYSIDPTDVSRVIQERVDGARTVGRLVDGEFVPEDTPCP